MSPFRPLTPPHLPDLLRALQTEPVTNVFLLHLARRTGLRAHGGTDFYGHRDEKGRLIGAGAFGPTLLPWAPRPETAALIADEARRRWGQWRALLGEARSIDSLWERLKPGSRAPAEDHLEDWLALTRAGFVPSPSPCAIRRATESDLSRILPLRLAMQEEGRRHSPYQRERLRRRCLESIRDGHLFFLELDGEVAFTAAFSASTPETTQISSVYTHEAYRGRGLATGALSTLCTHALNLSERVSLFVLPENAPAQRVYGRLGFRRIAAARSIRLGS